MKKPKFKNLRYNEELTKKFNKLATKSKGKSEVRYISEAEILYPKLLNKLLDSLKRIDNHFIKLEKQLEKMHAFKN